CPYCAHSLESIRAIPGASVRCPACVRPVLVVPPPIAPLFHRPPPLPSAQSARHLPVLIGVLLLIGLALTVAACVALRQRQEERKAAQANAQVVEHIAAARTQMEQQHWD